MNRSLATHVLLQLIFLLSSYVAAKDIGKNYTLEVSNASQRKFNAVVEDENGAVKKSQDKFGNSEVIELEINEAIGATCYNCKLSYVEKNVEKTVSFVVFDGVEVEKQLGHQTDGKKYVLWLLTDHKVYDITTKDTENAPYKTWEELESEANSNNHNDNCRNRKDSKL